MEASSLSALSVLSAIDVRFPYEKEYGKNFFLKIRTKPTNMIGSKEKLTVLSLFFFLAWLQTFA